MGCYTLLPCAGAWDLLQSVYKLGTVAVFRQPELLLLLPLLLPFVFPNPVSGPYTE